MSCVIATPPSAKLPTVSNGPPAGPPDGTSTSQLPASFLDPLLAAAG
jgi:hypothetical protein